MNSLTCGTCGKELNDQAQWLRCRSHFTGDMTTLREALEMIVYELGHDDHIMTAKLLAKTALDIVESRRAARKEDG